MKLDLAVADDALTDELQSGIHLARIRFGEHLHLVGILGQGSSAIVYEATNTKLQASVAVKVLEVEPALRDNAKARLLNEARTCARLEDPRIPRIYDVGELPDGTPYTVMEKVSGSSLEAMLQKGPIALPVAQQIIDELLWALEAVHSAGIVHRDVKPANIMVQLDGEGHVRLRLMDFGICTSLRELAEKEPASAEHKAPTASETHDLKLTQQGTIVGTPHYMAPEQVGSHAVDGRTDLYAAALVLYEMLAGETPLSGETLGQLFASILDPTPVSERKPNPLPARLKPVIDRAAHSDRTQRYASARAMREALRQAFRDAHVATAAASTPVPEEPPYRPLLLGMLCLGCGLLVALLLSWGTSERPAAKTPIATSAPVSAPSTSVPSQQPVQAAGESTGAGRASEPRDPAPALEPRSGARSSIAPGPATAITERLARDAGTSPLNKAAPRELDGLPPNPY